MLFVNQKTVKYPELLSAIILAKTFYRDVDLFVGDNDGITDIYSKALAIGIEVVQSEFLSDFLLSNVSKLYQQGESKSANAPQKPQRTSKARVLSWSYNTELDDEQVMEQFKARINDKLKKLNSGNYAKIKNELNLAVLSYMRVKTQEDARTFVDVYKQEIKKFKKGFDKIFLIFSSGIFYLQDDDIIAEAEFVGNEFIEYQKLAQKVIKEKIKQVF